MQISFYELLIFFGGGMSLLMAAAQFLNPNFRNRKSECLILSIFFFSLSFILLHFVFLEGIQRQLFRRFALVTAVIFLIGPSFYLYINILIKTNFRINIRQLLHFVPAVLSLIVGVIFQFLYPLNLFKSSIVVNRMVDYPVMRIDEFIILRIGGLLHILIYLVVLLYSIVSVWSYRDMNIIMRLALYSIISIMVIVFILIASIIAKWIIIMKIALLLTSALLLLWYLVGQRNPEFLQWFSKEMKKKRYERSRIRGLAEDDIIIRLKDLMEGQKIFCDEDLTLQSLADELSVTSHQLSEFINSKFDMNFNSFVNRYRVEEAKDMLVDEPERSILSVAYAVGFNSKSVFYDAFSKFTGQTPIRYRKQIISSLKKS